MSSAATPLALLRTYVLPALWLFVLPLFGLWFSGHATDRFNQDVLATIEEKLGVDAELGAEERQQVLGFFRATPASVACLDTGAELQDFRSGLGESCADVQQLFWMGRLALATVLLGLASALIALLCTLAAFVSRPFQYGSFVVGWNVLRVTGALQTAAQGALAVWLSYWVTAVWLQRYSPKLILFMGVIAAGGLFLVIKAIFHRPVMDFAVEAERIEEARAPELWAHVRQLCARLQAPPPDHLLAGIDANFFVTEAEVRVGERTLTGRTLYVSLSLLRLLERSEADAVLAHEVAHLLGGDTGHGQRLAPMLARYEQYLGALREGILTLPIFHFMLAYRALFELSIGRSRRAEELAADRLAASITSGRDIARSLVKVGAYASFRERVEVDLFGRDEQQGSLAIPQRVALGFAEYAGSEDAQHDVYGTVTPHPFDSHPPLATRLENVGEAIAPSEVGQVLLAPTTSSWASAILDVETVEARLWGAYEARFAEAHDVALAYRYEPATDAERQHVEKHFPALTFTGKKPGYVVQLDFAQVSCTGWEGPLLLGRVKAASTEDHLIRKYLVLTVEGGGLLKGKRSICLSKLKDSRGLIGAFDRYLGRHRAMVAHRERAQRAA